MYLRLVDGENTILVLSSMHSVSRLLHNSCSSHHGINFFYVVEKTLVICVWYNSWIVLADILGIVVVWKVILAFHAIVKEITSRCEASL